MERPGIEAIVSALNRAHVRYLIVSELAVALKPDVDRA